MISEISAGLTPLSSATLEVARPYLAVWLRAISAATVTMLRSRGARPGRFHRSASGPWAYFSSAGATFRTLSSVLASNMCLASSA